MFWQQFSSPVLDTMLDVDKTRSLLDKFGEHKSKIPRRCRVLLHRSQCLDFIQFHRLDDFVLALRPHVAASLGLTDVEMRGYAIHARCANLFLS